MDSKLRAYVKNSSWVVSRGRRVGKHLQAGGCRKSWGKLFMTLEV